MANTISDRSYREGYYQSRYAVLLRRSLIAMKICDVDQSGEYSLDNPYGSQPTATQQSLTGTYTPADFTLTDQKVEANQEIIVSEHIFHFQKMLTKWNLMNSRMDELFYAASAQIDKYVLNDMVENANQSYTTAAGNFLTKANIPTIFGELLGKVAGYADMYKGLFLVIENTEVPGLVEQQVASGFSYADMALKNGFMRNYMGVDIYVTRTGTFADTTINGVTYTNANNRVFGVKGSSVLIFPVGIVYDEKKVSGKTGKEVVVVAYTGHKLFKEKEDLVVDITLTASA